MAKNGTNSQIEFFCDQKLPKNKTGKDKVADIAIGWSRKKEIKGKQPQNTFKNLFHV